MPQPAQLPEWNTGGANRVDPGAPKKVLGYTVSEAPSSSHWNWLFYTVYLWCLYLKNLAGEAITWTVAQAFNAGISVSGSSSFNAGSTLSLQGTVDLDLQPSGLPSTALTNKLSKRTLVKAWAVVQLTNTTPTLVDGANIALVSYASTPLGGGGPYAANALRVQLAAGTVGANGMAAVASCRSAPSAYLALVAACDLDECDVLFFNPGGATPFNPIATNYLVSIIVLGNQ